MSRPLYETEEDLIKEREIVERIIGDKFNIEKLPLKLQADFGLFDKQTGKLRRWLEVRRRNISIDKWPTLYISLDKMLKIYELVNITGIPLSLLADWTDATGRFDINQGDKFDDFSITWDGRNDMRDEQDKEPIMHIPIDRFTILGRKR
jgi:hypothetical protein